MEKRQSKPLDNAFIWFILSVVLSVITLFFLFRSSPEPELLSSQVVSEAPQPAPARQSPPASGSLWTETPVGPPMDVVSQPRHIEPPPSPRSRPAADQQRSAVEQDHSAEMESIALLVDSGDWAEAEQRLALLLEKEPKLESALIEMAMLQLIDKRDPLAARGYLEDAIRVNPDNEAAINELLVVYQETDQLEKGIEFLRNMDQGNRESGVIDYGIANALLYSGQHEEALEYYQRAVEMSGEDNAVIREEMAFAYVEVGRAEEGIRLLREVLDQETDPTRIRNLKMKMAVAYLSENGRDEGAALGVLNEILDTYPGDELISQIIEDVQSGRL